MKERLRPQKVIFFHFFFSSSPGFGAGGARAPGTLGGELAPASVETSEKGLVTGKETVVFEALSSVRGRYVLVCETLCAKRLSSDV